MSISGEDNNNEIVSIKHLNLFGNQDIILNDISFEIKKGDFFSIIGPDGAGKTSLFKCMVGLNRNYTGIIKIFGKDLRKKSREIYKKIGYISQTNNFDSRFPATVKEIVELGTLGIKKNKENMGKISNLTGISEFMNKRIVDLSGSQQQRVMITKALLHEPDLLILDEPDTAIDVSFLKLFYKLLIKLNEERKITIIWSSHDLDAVNLLSNKVAYIYKKLLFHGKTEEFFSDKNNLKKFAESAMHIHIKSHYH